ncbi:MAG: ABC transporter substrate-binding protein [Thermomicrobiales bacterium]
MSDRQSPDRFGRSINRRRLLQGSAALGVGAASGLSLLSASDALAQDVTKLKFSHDKANWQDFFVEQGKLAEAAIGVNWDVTPYSDTTSYQAAVLAALPTSDTPDLFTWWSGYRIEDLYNQGVLQDLSDIWSQDIADGSLPQSLSPAFSFGGKQWAVPLHLSYWVVFYNKKVFADNGLNPPTTWDEFLALCDTLKGAGVTPLASTQNGRWPSFIVFEEMVLRTDPNFYVELTSGRAKYTDPTAVQAMDTWKSLIEKEYFTSFDLDLTNDFPGEFQSGKVAMIPIGTWYQGTLLATGIKPGEDYDAFIMPNVNPAVTDNVIIVETGVLAVANKGSKVDAAKKMAQWWLTPDAQTAWAKHLGDAPANPNATSDNPVISNLLNEISSKKYTLYQRYWEASPVPIVEGAVDFLAQFMLNPGDEAKVLDNIQKLADSEWAKRGGPAKASPGATPTS